MPDGEVSIDSPFIQDAARLVLQSLDKDDLDRKLYILERWSGEEITLGWGQARNVAAVYDLVERPIYREVFYQQTVFELVDTGVARFDEDEGSLIADITAVETHFMRKISSDPTGVYEFLAIGEKLKERALPDWDINSFTVDV